MPLSGCTPVPASHPKSQKGGLDNSIPKEWPCCVLLTCVMHTAVATLVWMLENPGFSPYFGLALFPPMSVPVSQSV